MPLDLMKIGALDLFETLQYFDISIQPMEDNGYGAIGMSKMADVFSDIKNFSSHSSGYNLAQETEELCTKQKTLTLLCIQKNCMM